ncbi:hypothetical protein HY990_04235 [Candidatus Micrarchaeota archaeon]|nr:hypothetical protein [Candidatus Micrarchaeota archaeon]
MLSQTKSIEMRKNRPEQKANREETQDSMTLWQIDRALGKSREAREMFLDLLYDKARHIGWEICVSTVFEGLPKLERDRLFYRTVEFLRRLADFKDAVVAEPLTDGPGREFRVARRGIAEADMECLATACVYLLTNLADDLGKERHADTLLGVLKRLERSGGLGGLAFRTAQDTARDIHIKAIAERARAEGLPEPKIRTLTSGASRREIEGIAIGPRLRKR